ncbi:hypothetical protein Trydic_g17296 [Trypoxylus dichotomus]
MASIISENKYVIRVEKYIRLILIDSIVNVQTEEDSPYYRAFNNAAPKLGIKNLDRDPLGQIYLIRTNCVLSHREQESQVARFPMIILSPPTCYTKFRRR